MNPLDQVIVFFCLVSFCGFASGQPSLVTPAAASQPQTIHLNVLVKDKPGQGVRGLSEQAFTVMDNGQAQKLAGFKAVDIEADPGAVEILIVVDMINIGMNTVAWEREQVGEYLKQDAGKLAHPTSIAVLDERGLRMMNGSSTDGGAIQAAFEQFSTGMRPINRTGGWAAMEEMLEMSLEQFSQILTVEEARPGRKLVLYIGSGWPTLNTEGQQVSGQEAQQVFNALVKLTDSIRDSGCAIYELNPYQLGERNPFLYQSYLKPVTRPSRAEYANLSLGVVATHSGGRVLINGHDIAGEINDALRDAGSYYELTYDAPAADGANEYHAIDVRVNVPGVKAQTLAGYYADPQNVGKR